MPAISSADIQKLIHDIKVSNPIVEWHRDLLRRLEEQELIPKSNHGSIESLRKIAAPALEDVGRYERYKEGTGETEEVNRRWAEEAQAEEMERLLGSYGAEGRYLREQDPKQADIYRQHRARLEDMGEAAKREMPFLQAAALNKTEPGRQQIEEQEAAARKDIGRQMMAPLRSGLPGMAPHVEEPAAYRIPQPLPRGPSVPGDPSAQAAADMEASRELYRRAIRDYQEYSPEARVAKVPEEQKRANLLANETGDYKPYLQRATDLNAASSASFPSQIEKYMNPYQHHVVDRIGELGKRNFAENILPLLEAQFVKSGQFGSSRHADLAQRAARDQQAETQAAQRQALFEGYGQAADISNADKERMLKAAGLEGSLGQSTQQQRHADYESLQHAGDLNRQIEQQGKDAVFNEYARKYNHPAEMAGLWSSYMRGTPITFQQPAPQRQSFSSGDYRNQAMRYLPDLAKFAMDRFGGKARGGAIKEIEDRRK